MGEIDVKGLGCPTPVIKTKQAMDKNPSEILTVLVDNDAARENVSRLAVSKKYSVKVETTANEEYKIVLIPSV
jgi:tRNA 2-thiouridine synthesizing protein A